LASRLLAANERLQVWAQDFWIKPDVSGFGLAEFHQTAEIARAGETAALEKIPELKRRLADLEARLLEHPRQR
jgi:predicted acylesterase/phospholipase RssA